MTAALDTPSPAIRPGQSRDENRRAIAVWLFALAALVALMVVVGGATRLTDSGLSITEWRPVTGAVPPLSERAWLEEFEKYKQIPEYKLVNRGMSLDEFKVIYWWEWGHRFLGRLIGVAFLIPFVYFLIRRRIDRKLAPKLVLMFVLGGAQGALGWYMVASGLSDRVDVSPYRLAAHLGLALIIFSYILWVANSLWFSAPARPRPRYARAALIGKIFLTAVFAQIILGAFVAGNDAGRTYTDWPLMGGRIVPDGYFSLSPVARNFFENVGAVQFNHRLGAYALLAFAVWVWLANRTVREARAARILRHSALALVIGQGAWGVVTVIHAAPLSLALGHQALALVLLAVAVFYAQVLERLERGR